MAARTHYDVLGVEAEASPTMIREAYRHCARANHPDRIASSVAPVDVDAMAQINEAYRVLSDPGRRVVYDATLRTIGSAVPSSTRGPGSSRFDADDWSDEDGPDRARSPSWVGTPGAVHSSHVGPARIPWRMLLLCGSLAVAGIVVVAQFANPTGPPTPDGILRVGDCVTIESNGDAREVLCAGATDSDSDSETDTGTDSDVGAVDIVVRAFIPFDATCPGRTEPHRDRQGMGIACVGPAE